MDDGEAIYCSACGLELPEAPPVECPACGRPQWNDAKPCASALVVSDSKLLLVRRAHEPWKGMWDVPGGFCEPGEHPAETAAREVLEETGMQVRVVGFLGIWLDEYPESGRVRKRTLNVYYHAVPSGDAVLEPADGEVAEAAFFEASALPEEMAFPAHVPLAIDAWRRASAAGALHTDLLDRPGTVAG